VGGLWRGRRDCLGVGGEDEIASCKGFESNESRKLLSLHTGSSQNDEKVKQTQLLLQLH